MLYSCEVPHGVQDVWPAKDEKLCAAQLAQTVLLDAVQAPPLATAEPAAHVEQAEHGDRPLALHVEPATQLAVGAQTRPTLSQKKPDAHVQLGWPGSVPATYAAPASQAVQAASPALENVLAGQTPQFVLVVAEQAVDGKAPAAHTEHAAQGARPVAFQETPATQGWRTHAAAVAFHA